MQQMISRPNPGGSTRLHTIIITAITLFALTGFIAGFGVGALARPAKQTPIAAQPTTAPIASQKTTPTPAPATQAMPLGCPDIQQATLSEVADGTTTYTVSAQAKDKSTGHGCDQNNKPITAQGITCRLWLIKGSIDPQDLSFNDNPANVNNLTNPFQHEVTGVLQFDNTTPQVEPCNQGVGTWKYTISPSVNKGIYWLFVATDWNGRFYNWSWDQVIIRNN